MAGNLQVVEQPSGQRTTNTWDDQSRQIRVLLPDATITTNTYRFDRLRYAKEDPQGVVKYVWDQQNYLVETDEGNAIQAVYTSEPRLCGNLISQWRKTPTIWIPRYYHWDALGSARAVTDACGSSTDTYLHGAWGDQMGAVGTTANPFRWIGRFGYYYDSSLGTVYIRGRMYEPTSGRWSSVDPLFYPPSISLAPSSAKELSLTRGEFQARQAVANLYAYVGGRPTGVVDPTGLDWTWAGFVNWYYHGGGTGISLADVGLLDDFLAAPSVQHAIHDFKSKLFQEAIPLLEVLDCHGSATSLQFRFADTTVTDVTAEIFAVGHSTFYRRAACTLSLSRCCCCPQRNGQWRPFEYRLLCNLVFYIRDWFKDPLDVGIEPGGTPYRINADLLGRFGRSIYYLPNPCDASWPEMRPPTFPRPLVEDVVFEMERCFRWFPGGGYELPTQSPQMSVATCCSPQTPTYSR